MVNPIYDLRKWQDNTSFDDMDLSPLNNKMMGHDSIDKGPFAKTDLVIFEDSYMGLLPSNGIYLSEFIKIKALVENINSESSSIKIEGTPEFVSGMSSDIIMILTRKIGRDLFFELLPKGEKIEINEGSSCGWDPEKKVVRMSLKDHLVPIMNKEGRKVFILLPRFIVLAHELIHQGHYQDLYRKISETDFKYKATLLRPDLDDAEEQITIIGWVKDRIFDELSSGEDEDWSTEEYEKQVAEFYFPLNENQFQTSFLLPLRTTHRGTTSKNPSLSEMVYCGVDQTLEEALTEKGIADLNLSHPGWVTTEKIKKACVGRTPLTTAIAVTDHKLTAYLLQKGAVIDHVDDRGDTPLQTAIKSYNFEAILLLLKFQPNLFARDLNTLEAIFSYYHCLNTEWLRDEQKLHKPLVCEILNTVRANPLCINKELLFNALRNKNLNVVSQLLPLGILLDSSEKAELAVGAIKAGATPSWLQKNLTRLKIDWTLPNSLGETCLNTALAGTNPKGMVKFLVKECSVPSTPEARKALKSDELVFS